MGGPAMTAPRYRISLAGADGSYGPQEAGPDELRTALAGVPAALQPGDRYTIERLPDSDQVPAASGSRSMSTRAGRHALTLVGLNGYFTAETLAAQVGAGTVRALAEDGLICDAGGTRAGFLDLTDAGMTAWTGVPESAPAPRRKP